MGNSFDLVKIHRGRATAMTILEQSPLPARRTQERRAQDPLGFGPAGVAPAWRARAMRILGRLERHHAASFAHSLRVARLTMLMQAAAPGWVGSAATALLGSLLHDVGKLSVPAACLASRLPLTPAQRERVMMHAALGAAELREHGFPSEVVEVAAHHHERWDGGGYPTGQPAGAFPPIIRVVAVADAFTAMTEPGRAYRSPLCPAAALREVQANQGTQFDPLAVALLTRCLQAPPPAAGVRAQPPRRPPSPAAQRRDPAACPHRTMIATSFPAKDRPR